MATTQDGHAFVPVRKNIDALTSLRFFAAAHVLLFHSGAGFAQHAGLPNSVVTFLRNGWFGVSVFFVLSGFILAYTYRDSVLNRQGLFDFAVARVARIYPVYILALLLMLPLALPKLDWLHALCTLALVQSWGPLESSQGYYWVMQAWSLSVEASFYLLFPLLIRAFWGMGKTKTYTWLVIVGTIMICLATPQLRPNVRPPDVFAWLAFIPTPIFRSLEFVFGILICNLFCLNGARRNTGQSLLLATIALLILLLALTTNPRVLSVATILAGIMIYLLATSEGSFIRLMSSRALIALGSASYAIYILCGGEFNSDSQQG